MESAQKLGEAIYKAQQEEQSNAQDTTESKKDDDIVDAEYEEVDKK